MIAPGDRYVPWLRQLSHGWRTKPLKYLVALNPEELSEDTPEGKRISYIDIGSVDSHGQIATTEPVQFGAAPSRARRVVRREDVIVSTVRTYLTAIAHINQHDENLVASTGFAVLRARRDVHPRFLFYWVRSNWFVAEIVARSTGVSYPAINASELIQLPFPVINIAKQKSIAQLLDCETARVDELVAKQERLLDLLKENRQVLVAEAVCRGINPAAEMKESNIEWLGRIPKHWVTIPGKRLFRLVVDPAYESHDHQLLSIYTDIGVRPRKELEERGNKASTTEGYFKVRKGDFIFNKLLAWMGAIGLSNYDGVTSPAYDVLRPVRSLDPRYYDYLFRCGICLTEFRRHSRGIMDMRLRLYFEAFGPLHMPYPPPAEQQAIVQYLQAKTSDIDTLIHKAQGFVDLLVEYRSALITAAVTGNLARLPSQKKSQADQANPYFRRAVLAAEIVHELRSDSNLGRTKFQKLLFLSEHHAHLADLQSNYLRQAAGPYDSQMMHSVESQLEKQRWYKCEAGTGGEYHYVPLEAAGQHAKYFDRYWGSKSEPIGRVIALLKRADTRQSEIVATLYAAWNDLILAGQSVTDDSILHEVLHKWHEKKRQIPEKRWRDAIAWMRQHDLIPTGFGKLTRQKSSKSADGK